MNSGGARRAEEDRSVGSRLFLILPITFCTFVGGLIVWIIHLIRLSVRLRDVPNASIGISLVAVPVFLVLLGVFNYVFWGLRRNAE